MRLARGCRVVLLSACSLAWASGCTGTLTDTRDAGARDAASTDGRIVPDGALPCADDGPLETSVRRLRAVAIDRTLSELFPSAFAPGSVLASLPLEDARARPQSTPVHVQLLLDAGFTVGAAATCDATLTPNQCVEQWIDTNAARVWRRPLDATERSELVQLAESTIADGGSAQDAIAAVAAGLFTSASFLFLIEPSPDASDAPYALDPYALAARLAYFLWNGPPDAMLLQAAADSTLASEAGLTTIVETMLADPRAGYGIDALVGRWLPLRDPSGALRAFVRDVVLEGDGRWDTLMQSDTVFATAETAPVYGVPVPTTTLGRATAPAGQRHGVVTQFALLQVPTTVPGPENEPAPWTRGAWLRQAFLCETLIHPANVTPPQFDLALPVRERVTAAMSAPECALCHERVDRLGFGLLRYDFETRYRDGPIDDSGEVISSGDAAGPFVGAAELAERFARSTEVRACVAEQWVGHAFDAENLGVSACPSNAIAAFVGDGDIRALLARIATSQSFRSRR